MAVPYIVDDAANRNEMAAVASSIGLMRQSVVPPTVLDGRVPQDLLSSEDVVFDDMNSVS